MRPFYARKQVSQNLTVMEMSEYQKDRTCPNLKRNGPGCSKYERGSQSLSEANGPRCLSVGHSSAFKLVVSCDDHDIIHAPMVREIRRELRPEVRWVLELRGTSSGDHFDGPSWARPAAVLKESTNNQNRSRRTVSEGWQGQRRHEKHRPPTNKRKAPKTLAFTAAPPEEIAVNPRGFSIERTARPAFAYTWEPLPEEKNRTLDNQMQKGRGEGFPKPELDCGKEDCAVQRVHNSCPRELFHQGSNCDVQICSKFLLHALSMGKIQERPTRRHFILSSWSPPVGAKPRGTRCKNRATSS